MKSLFIMLVFLGASTFAFANGTGGGGVFNAITPEIVYHMSEQGGIVEFAYGQLVDGKWQVQHVELLKQNVTAKVTASLLQSQQAKQWVNLL